MADDIDLLRQYWEQRSERAFTELVSRHVNLVYSAALRHTGDPHQAEEITQAVFVTLARKSRSLRTGTVLAGWLFHTTRLTAANILRAEHRRQRRDHEAYMQSSSDETPDTVWPQVSPLLDEAIASLGERDRDAVVLRFLEGKNFREIGETLGASEEAVKMRVSRALDKLREYFTAKGIAISLTALSSAIAANTAQAAPAGLAIAIAGAAIQGAAVSTATFAATKSALNFMAWTKTNFAIGAGVAAVLTTQWYQISTQRNQLAALQQHQTVLQAQVRQSAQSDSERNEIRQLRQESAGLKNDLRLLRDQLAAQSPATVPAATAAQPMATRATPTATRSAPSAQAMATAQVEQENEEAARELGLAAANGDRQALKKLEEYSLSAGKDLNANGVALNDETRGNRQRQIFKPLWNAFEVITQEALKGSPTASQAISNALAMPGLKGSAAQSLGTLAGAGNESALLLLLNHEEHGLLLSSAISALKPAAANGEQRAINALAAMTANSKHKALWFTVADGLQKPAESGNAVAIDALIFLSGTTNKSIRDTARTGLRLAAQNQHAKAAEAVAKFGSQ